MRQVNNLKSFLSPRIDLHPHQSFVASMVILDPIRRYVLADEVGLGKTIEAGIVIHDLLLKKPDAKILIITPPSLSRQWFFEIFSSFSGQIFKLAELHDHEVINFNLWNKIIISIDLASSFKEEIIKLSWDLIVIDEVHQIIQNASLYNFISQVSKKTKDILLLSAIPIKKKGRRITKGYLLY